MRRYLTLAVAAVLLTAGCASDDDSESASPANAPTASAGASADPAERIRVLASTDVYGDIASTIGGEHVEVSAIIDGDGADPHSYEATARDQLAVRNADLVIANGGHYDEFLTRLLDAADGERTVVTAVAEAGDENDHEGDHEGEDEHADASAEESAAPEADSAQDDSAQDDGHDHSAEGNEHVWYDLPAMSTLATSIGDALSEIDPSHGGEFQANAAQFRSGVADLMERQEMIREAHGGAAIAVTEPLPVLLLTDCGLLDQTPAEFSQSIEEGNDVPVRVLQDTLNLFGDGGVELLVYNEQTTGPQTERVRDAAEDAGVGIVGMTETLPEGEDYLSWMGQNLDALRAALDGAA